MMFLSSYIIFTNRLKLIIAELALFLYCFKMPSLFAFYSCHRACKKKEGVKEKQRRIKKERVKEKF